MLKVFVIAALALRVLGRERYEGWVRVDRPRHVAPLEWGECDAPCGVGTKHENTRGWDISCNSHPCQAPLNCTCGNTDFLVVLDNTGSITQKNFFEAKQFLGDLFQGMSDYGGAMERSRVAMITYDNHSFVEFDFNDGYTFADVGELKAKIWNVQKNNGFTNTSGALWMAGQMYGTHQTSNKKVIIVLTDGTSNIDEHLVGHYAQELHNAGIGVFVLGIGHTINEAELKMISSKPEQKFYFYVHLFRLLDDIIGPMMNGSCCTIPPPNCILHSVTTCTATCDGGVFEEISTCEHYGFGGVVTLTETVVEPFVCNTEPCPNDIVCSHDGHSHTSPEVWEQICQCRPNGETVCAENPYDPHTDDNGETHHLLGCKWAKVWHPPGTQWIQTVSGGRLNNCTCPDPPPSRWHVWTNCEAICRHNGTWYYGGDSFSYTGSNGRRINCECKSYAKLQCRLQKQTAMVRTDPVQGCRWKQVWHEPGSNWTQAVGEGRMKDCQCTNPPQTLWNIDIDCVARCDFEGQIYHYPETTEWVNPNGQRFNCKCMDYAMMQCNQIREVL